MAPEMMVKVSEVVRDLAARTIDQAEKAFWYVSSVASKSLASIPGPRTELSKHALSFTEQNAKATRKLVQATDPQQTMQIQSEFLKSQLTSAGQHLQQIISEIISGSLFVGGSEINPTRRY